MEISEVPIDRIDISEFNTRKDLADGQQESSIEDLARSIERQGLLSPITVLRKPDGLYSLVAGQRRLLAFKHLGRASIPAIVRDDMSAADATALSLVENVHRADMNPRDKALAFKILQDTLGSLQAVSKETGVGAGTIRKYIRLLDLAPELQDRLAAGEARNTDALARLAQTVTNPQDQVATWERISPFTQDVQQDILKQLQPDLGNLEDLVGQATEGRLGYHIVHNCPFDCPTIPDGLKDQVSKLVENYVPF